MTRLTSETLSAVSSCWGEGSNWTCVLTCGLENSLKLPVESFERWIVLVKPCPCSPALRVIKVMTLRCKPVECDATYRYRQPLAFGVHQVAPEGRVLGAEEIQMSLYRQNDGLSEEGLMRHVSLECLA